VQNPGSAARNLKRRAVVNDKGCEERSDLLSGCVAASNRVSHLIIRYSALALLATLLVDTTCHRSALSNVERINYRVEFIAVVPGEECKHEPGIIEMALKHLSSGNYDQTLHARNALLKVANKSNACKQAIVHSLIVAMDQPNLDFERHIPDYYLWREGSQLLGELRAVEALDLLISHLDLTNGFHSSSMVFQPAILGVRQMGQVAIPKLALALQHAKPSIRLAAAYCLTEIGGVAAMNVLARAQEGERNLCVANFIVVSLKTFSYKTNKNWRGTKSYVVNT
jgi:hypothetical protein